MLITIFDLPWWVIVLAAIIIFAKAVTPNQDEDLY